ncbi:unnamed protein product [Anisakis simplex]|uniref:1-alkyl-2-acetylglycerophosphocholine esterase n=1 Tax=Anisakis simplex TaxID=6269 RepID=A0A0M3JYT7_ANISI|nr:unnamed protein product [Anisakis simplex]
MGITGSSLSGDRSGNSTQNNDGTNNSSSKLLLPKVGFGKYEVGCADIMIADGDEGDLGVFARIFYPSDRNDVRSASNGSTQSDHSDRPVWLPRKEYIDGCALYKNTSPRKLNFVFDWFIGERRINAKWHQALYSRLDQNGTKKQNISFPVVIFSHGLSACRHFYSVFCTSLASYGFVVAAIEHRDRSACWTYKLDVDPINGTTTEKSINLRKLTSTDNEFRVRNQQRVKAAFSNSRSEHELGILQLHKRVSECVKLLNVLEEINLGQCSSTSTDRKQMGCRIVLGNSFDWSQFKGRLNMSKSSIVGHSFGGATAIAASAFSTDFTTAIVLDGWMLPVERELYERIQQPTLFLNASLFQWPSNVNSMHKVTLNNNGSTIVTLNDTTHQSFTDFSVLSPGFISRKIGFHGHMEPHRCYEAILELTVHYIRKHSLEDDVDLKSVINNYNDFVYEGTNFDLKESA